MGHQRKLRIADCGLRIDADCVLRAFNPKSAIRNPKFQGLTLIEVVAATMIVSLMAVAALNALGAATKSANSIGNRAVAAGMADELLSEIMMQSYSDPNGSAIF